MIRKCPDCSVIWTNKQSTTKIDPKRVQSQKCQDCATFDYPIYTKRRIEADKSLAKPSSTK